MHNYLLYNFQDKRFLEIGRDWWYCGNYIIILEGETEFATTDNPHSQGLADYIFHYESYTDVDFRNIIDKSYLIPLSKLKEKYKILAEKHKIPIYGYNCFLNFTKPTIEYCIVTCSKKKFTNIITKLDLKCSEE